MHDCGCEWVCMHMEWSSYCRHKGRTHDLLRGSPSVLLSFVEDSDKSLIASPLVWVLCVRDFCLLLPGFYHILFAHNFCCAHTYTHTHRFFIIGSSVILFRLINNFLQLKSGLGTYLSLHAIHSPLQVKLSLSLSLWHSAISSLPPPTLILLFLLSRHSAVRHYPHLLS